MRTTVYVDGLNLYYCKLRANPSTKWLDLRALAHGLFPDDEITRVRYFTAHVQGRPDPLARRSQSAYLRALKATGGVDLHFGKFVTNADRMPLLDGSGIVDVLRTEEKRSDVNIAIHMLLDAMNDLSDRQALISNDADLRLPVRVLQEPPFSREVWVFNPASTKNNDLHPTRHLDLKLGTLAASQLPHTVIDGRGSEIHRPREWR